MADPDKSPLPEDPPVTIAEDEVERLLTQAESLAVEIAAEVGSVPGRAEGVPVRAIPAIGLGGEPDPLAATREVERTLSALHGFVAEPELEASAARRGQAAERNAGAVPRTSAHLSPTCSGGSDTSILEYTQPPHAFSGATGQTSQRSDGEARDENQGDLRVDEAAIQLPRERPQRTLGTRLLAALLRLPALARTTVRAGPRVFSWLLDIIDRPFRSVSPSTRRIIGYLAVVTFLMGIASFVLPGLLDHNSYDNLGGEGP
jgi:hypothetical protein